MKSKIRILKLNNSYIIAKCILSSFLIAFVLSCNRFNYNDIEINLKEYNAIKLIEEEDNNIENNSYNFRKGWSFPEPHGRWAIEKEAVISFKLLFKRDIKILLEGYLLKCQENPPYINIFVNNNFIKSIKFSPTEKIKYILLVKSKFLKIGSNIIKFESNYGCIPNSKDKRILHFFLSRININSELKYENEFKDKIFYFYLPYGIKHTLYLQIGSHCSYYSFKENTKYIIELFKGNKYIKIAEYNIKCNKKGENLIKSKIPLKIDNELIPLIKLSIISEPFSFSYPIINKFKVRYKESNKKIKKPNFIMFFFDALRYDHIGFANYNLKTTPTLDDLARKGIIFTRAYSQAPQTIGSIASLLTSRYPFWKNDTKLNQNYITLPQLLKEIGYNTILVSQSPWVSKNFNLSQGFTKENLEYNDELFIKKIVNSIIESLNNRRNFFLYAHSIQPHAPYLAPPSFYAKFNKDINCYASAKLIDDIMKGSALVDSKCISDLIKQYDYSILYGDYKLSKIIDILKTLNIFNKNLFMIISSDHGEEFMEHGGLEHSATLYEEIIHVPLIIYSNQIKYKPKKINCPIELISLAPTILELAGVSAKKIKKIGFEGKSLIPIIENENLCKDYYAFSMIQEIDAYAIISENYKLINCNKNSMGFGRAMHKCNTCFIDLNSSPETCKLELSSHEKIQYQNLQNRLSLWIKHQKKKYEDTILSEKPKLNKEEIEKLQSLGYAWQNK